MVKQLMGSLNIECLYRVDINFSIEKTNISTMLGRTAHALFLEDEEALRMLVTRYQVIFN